MNGKHLRDIKRNTEMLILVELLQSPSARLKEVAKDLDITVQGVSQYITAMRKEGLLKQAEGRYKPTRQGMQLLQEHFTAIKHDVDEILRRISVVDRCEAIAGKRIQKGQRVGLVMEDGLLMAYPGLGSSSKGTALESADEGDDIHIGQLEGIVDLELGKLLLIEAPSEAAGGSKAASVARVREQLERASPGLLAAGDVVGAALMAKATEEMVTIHAPVESSMSALSRGVDVAFCGTRDSIDLLLVSVAALKKDTGYDIIYRSFKA